MKYQVLVVYDSVAAVYGQPMFAGSVGAAVRGFSDEVNRADEKNPFFMHPDDFELYVIGEFDDQEGVWIAGERARVARGRDLKREK